MNQLTSNLKVNGMLRKRNNIEDNKEENIIIIEEKKKRGRQTGSKGKKEKYKLEWKGEEYSCKNYQEIADIVGKSKFAIGRLMRNENTFKCKERCKDLVDIKITKV